MTSRSLRPTATDSIKYTNKKSAHALTVKIEAYHKFNRKLNVRPMRLSRFEDIAHAADGVQ